MVNVAVVILNYNLKKQTLACIESVKRAKYPALKIIVVDNNSKESIEEDIKKLGVDFIQSGKNLGYSGGNNLGIQKALDLGVEYILVLNPDTTVNSDCIRNLVGMAEKNKSQVVGPKIYFAGSNTIWFAGGKFDKLNVIGKHIGVDEEDKGQFNNIQEVDFITGAAILVKSEVFRQIGLFDEKYFLYYEDADFCFRAKNAGFKVLYAPSSVVYHQNAQTTGLGSSLQDYYITRNRMLFASKFLPLRTRFALFREGLKNLGNPIRRKAFLDFLVSNFGKGNF